MEDRRYKFDFVGFGALNLDALYSLKLHKSISDIIPGLCSGGERIGTEAERQKILGYVRDNTEFVGKSGGGQSANTAVALARMGFRCGFIGKVGYDEAGGFLLKSLEGIDKSHIQRGGDSGMCLCILDNSGERANIVFPGCNDSISLDGSYVEYVRNSKVLYLTSFCSEEVLKSQKWLLKQGLGDIIVAFDPGEIYSRLGIEKIKGILKAIYIMFATSEELTLMTGKEPHKAIEDIIEFGTKVVVHKMSDKGSEIISSNGVISVPVTKADKVVDKTGAGDVYAAGFMAGLLLNLPLDVCGSLASSAAALSITAYGRERYPDRKFLENFLNSVSLD